MRVNVVQYISFTPILHICQNFANKFGVFLRIHVVICQAKFAAGNISELSTSSVCSIYEVLISDAKCGGFVSEY